MGSGPRGRSWKSEDSLTILGQKNRFVKFLERYDKNSSNGYISHMITVAEEIRKVVTTSPFLEEGLTRGVLNLSALARELKPQVEATLLKDVSESSIVMALKRLGATLTERPARGGEELLRASGDLTVRSNLSEFTFLKSDSSLENQKRLLDEVRGRSDTFVTFTQGVFESTIIVSSPLKPTVERIFADETQVSRLDDLSAIVVKFPVEAVSIPGVHYPILRQLAWQEVSIVEVISTYTELTLIIQREQVERAFSTLLGYFSG